MTNRLSQTDHPPIGGQALFNYKECVAREGPWVTPVAGSAPALGGHFQPLGGRLA